MARIQPMNNERLHVRTDRSGEAQRMKPEADYSTIGDYAIAAAIVAAFFLWPYPLAWFARAIGLA